MGLVFGENARHTFRKGQLIGAIQYVDGVASLVIAPARYRPNQGVYVIQEGVEHRYLSSSYLVSRSIEAAEVMGMDKGRFTIFSIADAITNWLPYLLMAKPAPEEFEPKPKAVGELGPDSDGRDQFVIYEQ